ncbi:hypothetical protein D3C84_602300 [compost metagenome]
MLGTHRHRYHLRCAGTEHCLVGDIHRLGDDDLVTGIEQALGHAIQGTLRAGQHHHLLRIDPLTTLTRLLAGNGLAQAKTATHIGVVRVTGTQTVYGSLDNRLRGIEIRVADRQQENFAPLPLQLQRAVVDVPGSSTVTGDTLGERGITHGGLLD